MNNSAAKFFFVGVLVFICLSLLAPYFGLHILTDAPYSEAASDSIEHSDIREGSSVSDESKLLDRHSADTDEQNPVEQLLMDKPSADSPGTRSPENATPPAHDSLSEVEKILGQ